MILMKQHTVGSTGSGNAAYYSGLAGTYDGSYATPTHRRVYDRLAQDYVSDIPLARGAAVIDVGCGTGRWLPYWFARGCRVVGVENAPGMLRELETAVRPGDPFTLLRESMEEVLLPEGTADLVVAMGSMQYARDPGGMLRRFHDWLRPGGTVCVYVDCLVALVLELRRSGRQEEAARMLSSRRGALGEGDATATMLLYERRTLEADLERAGFVKPRCHGLAVGATVYGRVGLADRMRADEDRAMARERELADEPALVDLGLHILAIAERPAN